MSEALDLFLGAFPYRDRYGENVPYEIEVNCTSPFTGKARYYAYMINGRYTAF